MLFCKEAVKQASVCLEKQQPNLLDGVWEFATAVLRNISWFTVRIIAEHADDAGNH